MIWAEQIGCLVLTNHGSHQLVTVSEEMTEELFDRVLWVHSNLIRTLNSRQKYCFVDKFEYQIR